jgi:hypothetical protein
MKSVKNDISWFGGNSPEQQRCQHTTCGLAQRRRDVRIEIAVRKCRRCRQAAVSLSASGASTVEKVERTEKTIAVEKT